MPALFYKTRFLIAIICSILLLALGCKKTAETQTVSLVQQIFEQNILNRDFIVNYAANISGTDTTDITSDYTGYVFRLEKNTTTNSNTDGPMNAKVNGTVVCTGTWTCTEEYGKLGISLTSPVIASFDFINRDWKFTEKAFPIMKLAPWGVATAKILYMERL
ncbi:MAG: hypothetical protein ABI402_00915 [Ferruginibacter sp.]